MPQFCVATEVDIVEGQPRIDWIRSSSSSSSRTSSSRCISWEMDQQQFVWSNSNLTECKLYIKSRWRKEMSSNILSRFELKCK